MKRQGFLEWWNAPIKTKDRITSATLSFFAGFWIADLGRIFFGELPVSIKIIALYAVAGAFIGMIFGILFPKVMRCIAYPFAFFGVGSGS